jgi:hypothetical protein
LSSAAISGSAGEGEEIGPLGLAEAAGSDGRAGAVDLLEGARRRGQPTRQVDGVERILELEECLHERGRGAHPRRELHHGAEGLGVAAIGEGHLGLFLLPQHLLFGQPVYTGRLLLEECGRLFRSLRPRQTGSSAEEGARFAQALLAAEILCGAQDGCDEPLSAAGLESRAGVEQRPRLLGVGRIGVGDRIGCLRGLRRLHRSGARLRSGGCTCRTWGRHRRLRSSRHEVVGRTSCLALCDRVVEVLEDRDKGPSAHGRNQEPGQHRMPKTPS